MMGAVEPAGMTAEGYIIDQRKTKALPYGNYLSDYNGCGWVAAYNLLHACGAPDTPEEVCAALQELRILGGRFGTHPLRLWRWLDGRLSGEWTLVRCFWQWRASALAETARYGIVYYWRGECCHYAMFARRQAGTLQFYNAIYGAKNHQETIAQFLRKRSWIPLMLVIGVK